MFQKQIGKIAGFLLLAVVSAGLALGHPVAFAADDTINIFIGNGAEVRHHMSVAVGNTSGEYRFELKGHQAKSSNYSSSDTSVFRIVNTGEGKCKVEGLKEGTGWVILTIETTDGKTLVERVYISVYTKIEQCTATTEECMDFYRGASTNAEVENNDKKGVLPSKEKVAVLGGCGEYYYVRIKEGTEDSDVGFVIQKDLLVSVESVTIIEQEISIEEGGSRQLNIVVTPKIAGYSDLLWKSGNDAMVSVDASGTIKGLSEGTTMISAASKEDSTLSATTYVSVYKKTEEAKGYIRSDTNLYAIGNDLFPIGTGTANTELTVVGTCGEYYRVKTNIQTIQEKYNGYCYIPKSEITIPVTDIKISREEVSLSPGQTIQLSAAVIPEMADDHSVKWTCSKGNVVTVDQEGYVTARKVGTATVAAISADGSCTDQCIVHVTENKMEGVEVTSKPVLSVESHGMNSIYVTVNSSEESDGFILYSNGKEHYDYKSSKRSWGWTLIFYGFSPDQTYNIKARTYTEKDGKRKYSEMSNEQKIKVGKTNITVNVTESNTITVHWKKMNRVKVYEIYRAGERDGGYKLIKTVQENKTSYKDKSLKTNKKYYYKVKTVAADDTGVWSNIDYATACKLGNAEKYIVKKYSAVCTDKKNINAYHVNGCYSPVKYRMVDGTLQIHVYLEFVAYKDTGKVNAKNQKIFKKKKSTSKRISMFKKGIREAYSGVKVSGGKGNFKKGIKFTTKLIIHDKTGKEKYNAKQNFIEVLIGGECPNCTKEGEHWYHAGPNYNASGYCEYENICTIYMPTDKQVEKNTKKGYNRPKLEYGVTAAHELGHILGLDDAYPTDNYDRCADNSETGYKYNKKIYDNLMKYHYHYKKINANGIEMMLEAVDANTGIPNFASQHFKSYDSNKISEVIQNHKDYQKDK